MKLPRVRISNTNLIAAGCLILLVVISYGAVVPSVVAKHYMVKLNEELVSVQDSLKNVATEANLPMFIDPDINLVERQRQLGKAMESVRESQSSLNELDVANQLSQLPGTGFAGDYHAATVRHREAQSVVSQSRHVLDEYSELLAYLAAYTDRQITLDNRLNELNQIHDFNTLALHSENVAAVADEIKGESKHLNALTPPEDFAPLHTAASSTFNQAASSFERLTTGLVRNSDSAIYAAVGWIEATSLKNQVTDKDLLVSLADDSPTLRQLAELPEKVEHALGL